MRPVDYGNRAAVDLKLLSYTTAPLEREVTGYQHLTLYFASTHVDAAIFVYLELIDCNGHVHYLSEGLLRIIHHRLATEEPPTFTLLRSALQASHLTLPTTRR